MTQGSTQKRDDAGHFLRKDQNGPFGNYENNAIKMMELKSEAETVGKERKVYRR